MYGASFALSRDIQRFVWIFSVIVGLSLLSDILGYLIHMLSFIYTLPNIC